MANNYALILDVDLAPGSNTVRILDSDDDLDRLRGVGSWNPYGAVPTVDRNRFSFEWIEDHSLENVDTGYPDPASIQRVRFNG